MGEGNWLDNVDATAFDGCNSVRLFRHSCVYTCRQSRNLHYILIQNEADHMGGGMGLDFAIVSALILFDLLNACFFRGSYHYVMYVSTLVCGIFDR